MSTIPAYCPTCLRWMSQHVDGRCPDSVLDRLTLIARDVHLYDGGGHQSLTGLGARRIADAILSQFDVMPKGADRTDDEFAAGECDGSATCSALMHVHGCYTPHRSDQCDSPDEYGHTDRTDRSER